MVGTRTESQWISQERGWHIDKEEGSEYAESLGRMQVDLKWERKCLEAGSWLLMMDFTK